MFFYSISARIVNCNPVSFLHRRLTLRGTGIPGTGGRRMRTPVDSAPVPLYGGPATLADVWWNRVKAGFNTLMD